MSRRTRGFALAVTITATLLSASPAVADHQKAQVTVSAHASARLEQGYVLDVHLQTSDGRPVNEATVRFYDVVEFFGRREMLITSAVSDGQGRASVTYLPARTGAREIVVRFPGRDHIAPAQGRLTLQAIVAAPQYKAEPSGLALFSTRVPYVVASVVLVVWALIAFALFGTARGVLRGTRDYAHKEDTA